MEGFKVSEATLKLCKEVLDGNLSYEEYLDVIKKRAGMSS